MGVWVSYIVTLQVNHCPKGHKKNAQTVVISHHQEHLCHKKVDIYKNRNKNPTRLHFSSSNRCFQKRFIRSRCCLLLLCLELQEQQRMADIYIKSLNTCAFEISTKFQPLSYATLRVRGKGLLDILHANSPRTVSAFPEEAINKNLKNKTHL